MSQEKKVDESWKEAATQEKEQTETSYQEQSDQEQKFDFRAYITSLAMQALIFMGVIPNPMSGEKIEKNLDQARLLIDTLLILREKTQGNLNKEEEDLLNSILYELQVKFVDETQTKETPIVTDEASN